MRSKIVLFFGIIFTMTVVGCVGPRTGSVGHRYVPPVMTTNISGTVVSQQVGDQPAVMFAQTNFTVVSTSPAEERTWREKVLGQRPPGATSPTVIPPFPNAGVYGVTPAMTAPQGTRQGSYYSVPRGGAVFKRSPSGRLMLAPSWQGSPIVGGGTRRFLAPTVYGESRARIATSGAVWGHVNVPLTGFERKALGHAASIGTPLLQHGHHGRERSYNATIVVAGGGQFRSGLR